MRQAANFAFARFYYAGHSIAFYQPLAYYTMFERAINGKDLATGLLDVGPEYVTVGPQVSAFREGNSSVPAGVLPANATYNPDLDGPNPP